MAALLAFLAVAYWRVLSLPFVNDDYCFIDKTRTTSYAAAWGTTQLMFGWYRPWSAESHYWLLQRIFGFNEASYHIVSLVLWLGMMALYFGLVTRVAGDGAATIATLGTAALTVWSTPLIWVAGAQDLWMLFWVLVCLHAHVRGRPILAVPALAMALFSKETAGVTPLIALAYSLAIAHRRAAAALRECAGLFLLVGVWAVAHPSLRHRLLGPSQLTAETEHRLPAAMTALKALLAQVNLDAWPRPQGAWSYVIIAGIIGAAALSLPILILRPQTGRTAKDPILFGLLWAGAGFLPLFMPSIGWHAYYGSLGTLGFWVAAGVLLRRRPRLAAGVVATLAILQAARTVTPSMDWGTPWYQIRAASLLRPMRSDLLRLHPTFPLHSRLYFARVPNNIGFIAGDGPALRVWYGDSTIQGRFYSDYEPRREGAAKGADYFFRFDSSRIWVEVHRGSEDIRAAMVSNPEWEHDHWLLASVLARAGDISYAADEFGKLAAVSPLNGTYAYYAGVCQMSLGDSAQASTYFHQAASLLGRHEATLRATAKALLLGPSRMGSAE